MAGVKPGWNWEELWRRRLPTPRTPAQPKGFPGVRLSFEEAEASLEKAADRLALPKAGWGGEDFNILAISGGAAGGAFGAGVLVGLSQAQRRPSFAIVTGVSTGALIAPFAFLGPEWDARLTDAYTGGHAAQRLALAGLSGVLNGGLFRAEDLDNLIALYVDEAMLQAIAREHRLGRRLLIATTDLDSQRPAIWDMGEIASRGGEGAVRMFREVLAASASLPGLFPPRLMPCESEGEDFEELHVDGGVTAPLFVMPEALLRWRGLGQRMRKGRVYAILNTVIDASPRTTSISLPSILLRSFDTMLRVSYRQALNLATTFCVAHNISLSVAAIPSSPAATENGAMLDFNTASMRANFDLGRKAAASEALWRAPSVHMEPWEEFLDLLKA